MSQFQWHDSSLLYSYAHGVVERLQRAGYVAYFAGGCVRDALMGNTPHDYDVATDARLEQVIELFGERNTLGIGAAFGVACVHGRLKGERLQVEVATFRADGTYSDGRHPDSVVFTSPEEDAKRRDFTINGMFFDPIRNELHDFVGGREDLQRRLIRAIGSADLRFAEDKLRMLRAVRFGSRFGFGIEESTQDAISRHASGIVLVSGERIAIEMEKLLETSAADWGVEQLYRLGLWPFLMPEVTEAWSHAPVRSQCQSLLKCLIDQGCFASRLGAILLADRLPSASILSADWKEEIAKSSSRSPWFATRVQWLKENWKLSNEAIESLSFSLRSYFVFMHARRLPWSVVQPLLMATAAKSGIHLARAVSTVQGIGLEGILFCEEALRQSPEILNPRPFLLGDDLMAIGMKPGPSFAKILVNVRAMQLDGEITSKTEALEWVRSWNEKTAENPS